MKEEAVEKDQYVPTDAQQKLLDVIRRDFRSSWNQKHKSYRHLNNRTLDQFVADSRDAVDCYAELIADEIDSWQSTSYKPKTRNKTFAQAASLTASGIGIDIAAVLDGSDIDRKFSRIAEDVYEFSLQNENFDFKQAMAIIEQSVTGTVHIMDEVVWEERTVKEVVDVNFDEDKVEYKEKTITDFKGCRSEIVPIEEIYVGNIFEPDIQAQPHVERRKLTSYTAAKAYLSRYEDFKYVKPGKGSFLLSDENEIEAKDALDEENDDSLELLWYWRKSDDTYALVANGILLTDPEMGFPNPHKKIPMAKGINAKFGETNFYFGNSAPNMMRDEQMDTNDLWRMMLDSVKLSVKPPVATDVPELMDSDVAVPGAVVPKSPDEVIEVLEAYSKGLGNDAFSMLKLLENQIDESSMDSIMTGQKPNDDPTATEVKTVAAAAERLRNLSELFLGDLMVQMAHLRIPNALWFLMQDDDGKGYSMVVRDDVQLRNGKNGKRKLVFTDVDLFPDKMELKKAEKKAEKRNENVELLYIDRNTVENYRMYITVSPIPKPRRSSGTRIMRALEKYRIYAQNQQISQEKNSRELVEAFGDNPDEWVTGGAAAQMGQMMPGMTSPSADAMMAKEMMKSETI